MRTDGSETWSVPQYRTTKLVPSGRRSDEVDLVVFESGAEIVSAYILFVSRLNHGCRRCLRHTCLVRSTVPPWRLARAHHALSACAKHCVLTPSGRRTLVPHWHRRGPVHHPCSSRSQTIPVDDATFAHLAAPATTSYDDPPRGPDGLERRKRRDSRDRRASLTRRRFKYICGWPIIVLGHRGSPQVIYGVEVYGHSDHKAVEHSHGTV